MKMAKNLTLNIWQLKAPLKIKCTDGKEIQLPKNNLLFLIDRDGDYLIFQTEIGMTCKIHISLEKKEKIIKVFSCG